MESSSSSSSPKKSLKKAKIASRRNRTKKKRMLQRDNNSHSSLREFLRFQPEMEDLKNACKRNDLVGALVAAHSLSSRIASSTVTTATTTICSDDTDNHTLLLIRVLFTPDIEGRSAIYYAAHTGNVELVEMLLALLVLGRAWRHHHRRAGQGSKAVAVVAVVQEQTEMTMLGWLEHFGFPCSFFFRTDFDVCICNALNERTKEVFYRTKFSWELLLKMVKSLNTTMCSRLGSSLFLELCIYDESQHRTISCRRKRLPKLCLDDEDDPDVDFDELDLFEVLRLHPQMQNLKNACKQHDLVGALVAAHSLSGVVGNMTATTSACNRVLLLIRILCTTNTLAMFFAAGTGQSEMVKTFLALLVLERAERRRRRTLTNVVDDEHVKKTMLGWLQQYCFPCKFFCRSYFNCCILNALNKRTEDVFHRTKFSWGDILKTVKSLDTITGNRFGHFVFSDLCSRHQVTHQTTFRNRKQRLPKICLDDNLDPHDEMGELDADVDLDDYCSSVEDEEIDSESDECPKQRCDPFVNAIKGYENYSPLIAEHAATAWLELNNNVLLDDFHETRIYSALICRNQDIRDESLIDADSSNLHDSVELAGDGPSTHSVDTMGFHLVQGDFNFDWNDEIENGVVPKDEISSRSSAWELSNSPSVISFDSQFLPKSYLEVLLENNVHNTVHDDLQQQANRPSRNLYHHQLPKVYETEGEEDDDIMLFDAWFDLECAKGARGGKKDRMFKEGRMQLVVRTRYR